VSCYHVSHESLVISYKISSSWFVNREPLLRIPRGARLFRSWFMIHEGSCNMHTPDEGSCNIHPKTLLRWSMSFSSINGCFPSNSHVSKTFLTWIISMKLWDIRYVDRRNSSHNCTCATGRYSCAAEIVLIWHQHVQPWVFKRDRKVYYKTTTNTGKRWLW